MSDSEAGFQSLLGSIQSHLEDRLKSPFGGAFVISWIAINWKPVLVLMASDARIEDRISIVSATYFSSAWNYLWWPLLCAVGGVLSYYVFSTIFVVFYEGYGVLRRFVERKFDSFRWVPPATYIEMKRESREKIEDLSSLAADQLGAIEELRGELSVAEAELAAAQLRVEEESKQAQIAKGVVDIQTSMNSTLEAELKQLRDDFAKLSEKNSALANAAAALDGAAQIVGEQLTSYLSKGQLPIAMADARTRRPLERLAAARSALDMAVNERRELV
jgi:hypothetical protein